MIEVAKVLRHYALPLLGCCVSFLVGGVVAGVENQNIAFAFVGAALGFTTNLITSYMFLWYQFEGTGQHRVKIVAEATRAFRASEPETSILSNKYRYGLGKIIDELRSLDPDGFKKEYKDREKVCPSLNEGNEKDRWDSFNRYVRPVLDDVNAYEMLRSSATFNPTIRQLSTLIDLCNQIEVVVMNLDALGDKTDILDWQSIDKPEIKHLILKRPDDPIAKDLRDSLRELYTKWSAWEEAVKP